MTLNEGIRFRSHRALWLFCASLLGLALPGVISARGTAASADHWEIKGQMSEACTCQVPCTCNFRQGPSPHHFCWSLASFEIVAGHYNTVDLSGLHLVRAHGRLSIVWYVDSQATASQTAALKVIASRISQSERIPMVHFEKALISQTIGNHMFHLKIGDYGGFEAAEIIGRDGKNPIVVENMTAWNVDHDIKGKTSRLEYRDQFGNQFNFTDTNANQAAFDWTDATVNYF
jgi:hypothetical protein